jgi:hypothetical protein
MKLDFKEQEKRERFPEHGWAANSEGVRLIWLPIMRVLANSAQIRSELGVSRRIGSRQQGDVSTMFATLNGLSAALRELAAVTREIESLDPIEGDNKSLNRQAYLSQLTKLYVDTSIMYLRRLSDAFCRAIRYVLFDHFESAPRELKKLVGMAASDKNALAEAGPLCDIRLLKGVLCENTEWFRDIRGMKREGCEKKGIRDVLEHQSSSIEIFRRREGRVRGEPRHCYVIFQTLTPCVSICLLSWNARLANCAGSGRICIEYCHCPKIGKATEVEPTCEKAISTLSSAMMRT